MMMDWRKRSVKGEWADLVVDALHDGVEHRLLLLTPADTTRHAFQLHR
jgi:hypothetical protein